MYRIMIVEDDDTIAALLKKNLEGWGYEVFLTEDFSRVIQEFVKKRSAACNHGSEASVFNGYHWCDEIRRISQVPVLFLSSASDNMNMVMALSRGADDFMAKPFDLDVLVAKVQALIRRSYSFGKSASILEHRGAVLNMSSGSLTYEGQGACAHPKRVEDTGAFVSAGRQGGVPGFHYDQAVGERQLCG